jgi:hypothetical protein
METVFVRLDLEAFAFGRVSDGALEMLAANPCYRPDPLGTLATWLLTRLGQKFHLIRTVTSPAALRHHSDGGQDAA